MRSVLVRERQGSEKGDLMMEIRVNVRGKIKNATPPTFKREGRAKKPRNAGGQYRKENSEGTRSSRSIKALPRCSFHPSESSALQNYMVVHLNFFKS